jgi:D-3-phosphoglycerate dehydrogenase / 2-oxoglutarate reductase
VKGSYLIVIAEPHNYSPEALRIYRRVGPLHLGLDHGKIPEIAKSCKTLVVRLGFLLDKVFLEEFESLEYIVSPTTGLNHVDLGYCSSKGIQVLSLKNETSFLNSVTATAELTFGLILALVRHIPAAHWDVTEKGRWDRDRFRGRDLSAMVLGVLGFGRLGRKVARYGRSFGMVVRACDPYVAPELFKANHIESCTQAELFSSSDVLTVHVKLSPKTRKLITERDLLIMKPGSFLVNTSRGEIIDENALLRFLLAEKLSGAALDVLTDEQDVSHWHSHPLVAYARIHDNLIITPHIGGCTQESMEKTEIFMAKKYADLVQARVQG